jgi:ankyrin repeat protein
MKELEEGFRKAVANQEIDRVKIFLKINPQFISLPNLCLSPDTSEAFLDELLSNGFLINHHIIEAVKQNSIALVRLLVKKDPACVKFLKNIHADDEGDISSDELDENDSYETIPVNIVCHIAAVKSKIDSEMLKLLIELGIDIKEKSDGYTPLQIAILYDNLEFAKLLIQCGANVKELDMASSHGKSLLMYCAEMGFFDICKFLCEEYNANINRTAESGYTALMMAIMGKHSEIAQYLIERGADKSKVRSFKEKGLPLLTCAGIDGKLEIFKLIMEKIYLSDTNDEQIVNLLLVEIRNIIRTMGNPGNVFNPNLDHTDRAVREQRQKQVLEYILTIFEKKLSENSSLIKIFQSFDFGNGKTLLHAFAAADILKGCQFILDNKILLVDVADKKGFSPLGDALVANRMDIVSFLIQHNANTALLRVPASNAGKLILHYLAEDGNLEPCRFVIDSGILPWNVQDNKGNTPLRIARKNNRVNIVEYLNTCKEKEANQKKEISLSTTTQSFKGKSKGKKQQHQKKPKQTHNTSSSSSVTQINQVLMGDNNKINQIKVSFDLSIKSFQNSLQLLKENIEESVRELNSVQSELESVSRSGSSNLYKRYQQILSLKKFDRQSVNNLIVNTNKTRDDLKQIQDEGSLSNLMGQHEEGKKIYIEILEDFDSHRNSAREKIKNYTQWKLIRGNVPQVSSNTTASSSSTSSTSSSNTGEKTSHKFTYQPVVHQPQHQTSHGVEKTVEKKGEDEKTKSSSSIQKINTKLTEPLFIASFNPEEGYDTEVHKQSLLKEMKEFEKKNASKTNIPYTEDFKIAMDYFPFIANPSSVTSVTSADEKTENKIRIWSLSHYITMMINALLRSFEGQQGEEELKRKFGKIRAFLVRYVFDVEDYFFSDIHNTIYSALKPIYDNYVKNQACDREGFLKFIERFKNDPLWFEIEKVEAKKSSTPFSLIKNIQEIKSILIDIKSISKVFQNSNFIEYSDRYAALKSAIVLLDIYIQEIKKHDSGGALSSNVEQFFGGYNKLHDIRNIIVHETPMWNNEISNYIKNVCSNVDVGIKAVEHWEGTFNSKVSQVPLAPMMYSASSSVPNSQTPVSSAASNTDFKF